MLTAFVVLATRQRVFVDLMKIMAHILESCITSFRS